MAHFSYMLDKDPPIFYFVLKILYPALLKRFWIPGIVGIYFYCAESTI